MFKKRATILSLMTLCMALYIGSPMRASAAPTPITHWVTAHTAVEPTGDGGTRIVTYVQVRIGNPHILVQTVVANNHFGTTSSLATMAERTHAIAAINGTFFNAYTDKQPQGTLALNGTFEHLDGGTLLVVYNNGKVSIQRSAEAMILGFDHSWLWPHVLYPSAINSFSGKPAAISLLTSFYGPSTGIRTGLAVVVQGDTIVAIRKGATAIPRDGYVVELGLCTYDQAFVATLHVGEQVSLRVSGVAEGGTKYSLQGVRSALGAGPLLVNQGRIALNPVLEGFRDPKILYLSGQRSMLGIDRAGNLLLATVPDVTLRQLAHIAYAMHLQVALNGDGGASSGLYYNGHYLTQPGRDLADALTVSYVS